jgi:hypothetical protein
LIGGAKEAWYLYSVYYVGVSEFEPEVVSILAVLKHLQVILNSDQILARANEEHCPSKAMFLKLTNNVAAPSRRL